MDCNIFYFMLILIEISDFRDDRGDTRRDDSIEQTGGPGGGDGVKT